MRKLCAALLLLLCVSAAQAENTVGPTAQVICNKFVQTTISSSTTTSLVAGVAGQSIFICGWHVTTTQASSPVTFQFLSGTHTTTDCDTTPVNITPAFNILNTAPSADHISLATIQVPLAKQLCVASVGVTNLAVIVYYSQF